MQEYLSEVLSIKYLTLEVAELSVRVIAPEVDVQFVAGQSMQIKVEGKYYEAPIASPPHESNQTLTLCLGVPKGSLLAQFMKNVSAGSQLKLVGPAGDFQFKDAHHDIFCIAQGVGSVPFAALIPDLLVKGFDKKIRLLFEVRSEDEVFYFARFTQLAGKYPNFTFTPIVIRPYSHWPGEVGTAATYVQVAGKAYIDHAIYVAGDQNFVQTITGIWTKLKPEKGDIYSHAIGDHV